ncbi:MAG: SCO family protein, partial [Gammaproteobacteria bacterium]
MLNLLKLACIAGVIAMALFGATSQAEESKAEGFERSQALAISQAAIGRVVSNHRFFTTNGEAVSIERYRGRPLVLSMIFTSCYHICPTTTQHLAEVVRKARAVLGDDSFRVVTLGFDAPNDTADAMRVFAAQQSVNLEGWDFLSGDQESIDALAAELGFQYYPTPSGFDHLIQSSIIDSEGVV